MISGIIFKNMACIEYLSGKYHFITDWSQFYEGKEVSKKCWVTSDEYFYKKVLEILQLEVKQTPVALPFFPRVSIILPVYQGEKTLRIAIKSILKQTYNNIELIIVNDGSSDDTESIIFKMMKKYSQIKYIKNPENRGVYFSRNIGIKNSTGDFITIQDADDISTKNRLITSVYELITNKVDFILANSQNIENMRDFSSISIAMASLVIKKDFFSKYGLYDEETRHSGDLELLDRAHFQKYGKYILDNFWFWLNYTHYKEGFYKHIYQNLYYIGNEKNSITKNNNINKRLNYLNNKRKINQSSSHHQLVSTF